MTMTRPTALIIDGNSFIHRSFHALPAFTNKEGHPTSAITGALNMIVSLQKKYSPDKLVVCFDAKGKNFRHEIYPDYKGDRPPSDPALGMQFEPLKEIVSAWGVPMLCISGVEADDTMGTVAVMAVEEGYDVVISTSDKDMRQLVNEHIKIIDTKDTDSKEPYGEDGVIERMGVHPSLVRDLLAIMGDASDGVPGVHKVGKDTAGKWLAQYGSLQGVMENAHEIKGKRGEYLREALSHLPLSYELVTIDTQVPLPSSISDLTGERNEQRLFELVTKFELNQFKRDANVTNPNAEVIDSDIVYCDTQAAKDILNKRLSEASVSKLFIDVAGAVDGSIIVALNNADKFYVIDGKEIADTLAERYRKKNFPVLVGNNVKAAVCYFIRHGVFPLNPSVSVKDSRLYYYIDIGGRSKLPSISELNNTYVQLDLSPLRLEFKLDDKAAKWEKMTREQWAEVKAEELQLASRIESFFENDSISPLTQADKERMKGEATLLAILAGMEAHGLLIDGQHLNELDKALTIEIDAVETKIKAESGLDSINLNSPKQIGHLLFDVMGIPAKKPSTAEKVLLKLASEYPIVNDILRYRGLAKIRSTYINGLLTRMNENGLIHPQFNQGLTSTGRLSAENPNVQAIPVRSENGQKIREAFIAEQGYKVMAADYSQIEIRVLAHLSGDPALISAFESGKDIHRLTASEILGIDYDSVTTDQRRIAKAINFGMIYGIGANRLAADVGIPVKEAKAFIEKYFARYASLKEYFERQLAFAKENGYVQTAMGRKIYTPDVNASNPMIRVHAELSAKNAGIQGTAADIIKEAMLSIDRSGVLNNDVKMVMQVHDELVFYINENVLQEAQSKIVSLMEDAVTLNVPLLVESNSGSSWREAH